MEALSSLLNWILMITTNGIRNLSNFHIPKYPRILIKVYCQNRNAFDKFSKFEFISSSADGQRCTHKVNLNENTIWEYSLNCPNTLTSEKSIYITADESRVLTGQVRNFKFSTHDL